MPPRARRPQALDASLLANPISQPPHSAGTPLAGLKFKLTPAQIPSIVEEHYNDQERWHLESFVTAGTQPIPLATSEYYAIDQGNSTPRFIRSTLHSIPSTPKLAKNVHIPIALHVQPFAEQPPEEDPIPVVDYGDLGPPRCSHCRAYINPWCQWKAGGARWECNLCEHANEVHTDYFSPIDSSFRRVDHAARPELNRGTVDFVVPKEYHAPNPPKRLLHSFQSPDLQPPDGSTRPPSPMNYVFLIDVSYEAVVSGMVSSACSGILQTLYGGESEGEGCWPSASRVSIITFDRVLHFYDISPHLSQAAIRIVPDIDEVYPPGRSDLFGDPIESRHVLEPLLRSIPRIYSELPVATSALGSALGGALALLSESGGQVIAFQSTLPMVGQGALLEHQAEEQLHGTDNESMLYRSRDNYWKELAEECVDHGVGVSLILTPNRYIDVATLGVVPGISGGDTYYFPRFDPERDEAVLSSYIFQIVRRETSYQCAFRLRCSNGLSVKAHYGSFLERTATDLECGTMDADKSILAVIEHRGDALDEREPAFFQSAVLYTTREGQRRVRTCNLAVNVVRLAGSVFESAQVQSIAGCWAKQAVAQMPSKTLRTIRDNLTVECAEVMLVYRKYCAASAAQLQLIMPTELSTLPVLVNSILKSRPLKGSRVVADVRNIHARKFLAAGLRALTFSIYPRLYQLHGELETMGTYDPETGRMILPWVVRSSHAWMQGHGIYLIDDGDMAILWLGGDADPNEMKDLLGVESAHEIPTPLPTQLLERNTSLSERVRTFLSHLEGHSGFRRRFLMARQNLDGNELEFANMLIEDTNNGGMSYRDYLQFIHRLVANSLKSGDAIDLLLGQKKVPW